MSNKRQSSSSGEQAAIRGYLKQYEYSAVCLYRLMVEDTLESLCLSLPEAGIIDDLVVLSDSCVKAVQIKSAHNAKYVSLKTELNDDFIKSMTSTWKQLKNKFKRDVHLTYIFPGLFNLRDIKLANSGSSGARHSAQFAHFVSRTDITPEVIQSSIWSDTITQLKKYSQLNDVEFTQFISSMEIKDEKELIRNQIVSFPLTCRSKIEEIQNLLPYLVAKASPGEILSKDNLVKELGWQYNNSGYRTRTESIMAIRSLQDSSTLKEVFQNELDKILQRYLFSEFDTVTEIRQFVNKIDSGEFQWINLNDKIKAIAWCSIILAPIDHEEANLFLSPYNKNDDQMIAIARFRIRSVKGEVDDALSDIAQYNTSISRSIAYLAMLNHHGVAKANKWLNQININPSDLDDAALIGYLFGLQKTNQHKTALKLVREIPEHRLEQCAALNDIAAAVYLANASVDPNSKIHRIIFISMDYRTRLKDDVESFKLRKSASKCYSRLARLAREIDLPTVAEDCEDQYIWLNLIDPDKNKEALIELEKSLSDSNTLLRRFTWAQHYNIPFSLSAVKSEIERQIALSGPGDPKYAYTRLAMAMALANKEPADGARYLDNHRVYLYQHLGPIFVLTLESEILARAGETTQAHSRITDAEKRGLDSNASAYFHTMVDQINNQDDIFKSLLTNFQKSGSIRDRHALVTAYFKHEAFNEVITYGEKLVKQTRSISDVWMLAVAFYQTGNQHKTIKLIKKYPSLRIPDQMKFLHARSLFEVGELKKSAKVLRDSKNYHEFENARDLHLQLVITSGDWELLNTFIEDQWKQRKNRLPLELLKAGQIAQYIDSPYGEKLIRKAAKISKDDPDILIACFDAAVKGGWEEDSSVINWIRRATELSETRNKKKPIQPVSYAQIITEVIPEKRKQISWLEEQSASGHIPLFLVAEGLNQSLAQVVLSQAIWNNQQNDTKDRSIILTSAGNSLPATVNAKTVAYDPVSLLTLSYLDILEICHITFDQLIIPHGTLRWMFDEKAQLSFHQPSRVKNAHALRNSIMNGTIRVHEANEPIPEKLYREVGHARAELLHEAENSHDNQEKIVVIDGPIWKPASAMSIRANLGKYAKHVRSPADIIETLIEHGRLTKIEIDKMRLKYKHSIETEIKKIPENAVLLLDDLTASTFLDSKLLDVLSDAGFLVVISASASEEARQLIEYETRAEEVQSVIERLREWLTAGLKEGWIQLAKASREHDHPSFSLLETTPKIDAVIIDDRFFNKKPMMDTPHGPVPIITTWTLLDKFKEQGTISNMRWHDARATLRRSCYALAPVDTNELFEFIINAPVKNGHLVQTPELRALRENIIRVCMSDIVQIPAEITWLNQMSMACIQVVSQIWQNENSISDAKAKAKWLIDLGNPVLWAHRCHKTDISLEKIRCSWYTTLVMQSTGWEDDVIIEYRDWLESQVILPLQEGEPEIFYGVIDTVKVYLDDLSSHIQEIDPINEATNGK